MKHLPFKPLIMRAINFGFSFMDSSIHIGKAIRELIEKRGLVKKRVAEQMALTQQGLNSVFHSPAIRTDQLQRFCEVLDYNFFKLYSKGSGDETEEEQKKHIHIQIDEKGVATSQGMEKRMDQLQSKLEQISDELHELIHLKELARYLDELEKGGPKKKKNGSRA